MLPTDVDKLLPLIYEELRRLAGSFLRRERSDHTLQATALVHEAYMKLAGQGGGTWESRAHFLSIAARVMRQILVDHSRIHRAGKRGGGAPKAPLEEALVYSDERAGEVVDLDDALKALAEFDPRKAQMVEMRYFGGLTGEEIASVSGVSTATVTRELRLAQAWLYRWMRSEAAGA